MEAPQELSLAEIRKYMIANGCKVTNHALVKHFKKYLTHPHTQNEARKQFKTYVNILATIKNENNQKYLILRKKYLNECPSEEAVERAVSAASSESAPSSPGSGSIISEASLVSPFRQPPPYKPPPEVGASPVTTGATVHRENVESYRECINEFAAAVSRIDPRRLAREQSAEDEKSSDATQKPDEKETVVEKRSISANTSRANSIDEQSNKENIPRFSFSSGTSGESSSGDKVSSSEGDIAENPISVKEATRKFNRMASEEEAKVLSPSSKKKPEKQLFEDVPEVTLAHPKAKEWIVSMARANYQELAKLANDFPELVKLQDPSTGYTALHWAAKHGNEDVVKLIAGTYKADVNARTNGGYTPLHLAMQFGRSNIFELLCNSYKANRDLMDCSGNKPLDYSKQRTTVSASTYSKIKARRKHTVEKDLGFLRIGSLNVRVKKTTEAFSNFLGVGNGNGSSLAPMATGGGNGGSGMRQTASLPHQRSHRHHHLAHHHHHHGGTTRNHYLHQRHPVTTAQFGMMINNNSNQLSSRASVPINSSKFDKLHKSWGSADNIPHHNSNGAGVASGDAKTMMPPPKCVDTVKKRPKSSKRSSITSSNATDSPRDSISSSNSSSNLNSGGYSSMPTTPNQLRAPIGIGLGGGGLADSDSDSACGFGSNWSVSGRSSLSSGNLQAPRFS